MGALIIPVLCLLGAAACLGLAFVVLRRGRTTEAAASSMTRDPAPISDTPPPAVEPKTEFIPREELFGSVPWPAKEDTTTRALSPEDVFATAHRSAATVAPPETEMIPREMLLAVHQTLRPAAKTSAPVPPPEPAATKLPVKPGLTVAELEAQLVIAEQAFLRWLQARETTVLEQLADGPERVLQQVIGVLVAASDEASAEVLEPAVRFHPSVARRQVAALALLSRNETNGLRLIDQLVGDPQSAPLFREVLALWRSRETNWRLSEQARQAQDTKMFWLDLLDERRADPGPQLLRELLASETPEQLVRGLELAKYHDDAELRKSITQSYMHDMRHPARRMAAVELGVYDRQPAAWMLCRQMANSPEYPRATELIASLGTMRELDPLLRRLGNTQGEGIWLLCQSGRKAAAALAARRLQDTRGDELALSGLRYIIGSPPNEAATAEALLEHWNARAPELADDRRYLFGELFGGTNGIRHCLMSNDDRHHRALADELFFRSNGKIRWAGRGFAEDTLARARALGTPYLNYEHGFGSG